MGDLCYCINVKNITETWYKKIKYEKSNDFL